MNPVTINSNLYDHPISHQTLLSLLKDYKRPNDKIYEMVSNHKLVPLRRGLYVWNNQVLPEPFSIANVLYGPSYVSAESALSYRGIIPERVFSIVSMTLKQSKIFKTHLGNFEYIKLPAPYYAFGVEQVEIRDGQFSLMAVAEKALFDKVITTSGVLLRSISSAKDFMLQNLRIDEDLLRKFDVKTMQIWVKHAPKKASLKYIIKAIEQL